MDFFFWLFEFCENNYKILEGHMRPLHHPAEKGPLFGLILFVAMLLGTAFGTASILLGLISQHAISVNRLTIFACAIGILINCFAPYKRLNAYSNYCVGFFGGNLIGTGIGLMLRIIGAFFILFGRNFIQLLVNQSHVKK